MSAMREPQADLEGALSSREADHHDGHERRQTKHHPPRRLNRCAIPGLLRASVPSAKVTPAAALLDGAPDSSTPPTSGAVTGRTASRAAPSRGSPLPPRIALSRERTAKRRATEAQKRFATAQRADRERAQGGAFAPERAGLSGARSG